MTTYISLLRAINVGGRNKLPMAELRACAERIGFSDARTYIQSGNLVCSSKLRSPAAVSKRLSAAILEEFELDVPVISRSAAQWSQLAENNPFLGRKGVDPAHLYVTVLGGVPKPGGLKALEPRAFASETLELVGCELYVHAPDGSARSKLDIKAIERCFGVGATARNWRTVGKLLEMATQD